MIRAPRIG